ncbi:antibiotic biosynthesis monooxygenase [Thermococcus thermotolerans]|uniref:antibiotic biosynthesis monooxygenase n=1 Tax=Thermococcus thermotolerans TaxID=2969672 RepID=UPI002157B8F5|nr:antibiotic biosynthesis monooxygenase [Thermococcus thermotolerans]
MAVMRLWHGRVPTEKADEYEKSLIERAVLNHGSVKGRLKTYFTRKDEGDAAYFLPVTIWDSMESIKKFAGENLGLTKYYPEDDDFLLEKEKYMQHYMISYKG